MLEFNSTCEGSYKNYIGIFTNFLNEYEQNLMRLAELQQKQLSLLSLTSSGLASSNGTSIFGGNGSSGTLNFSLGFNMDADYHAQAIDAAQRGDWASVQDILDIRDAKVEAIGTDYGMSSDEIYNELWNAYGKNGTGVYNNYTNSGSSSSSSSGKYTSGSIIDRVNSLNSSIGTPGSNFYWKSYSTGLDNGPVTTTGPAILHGTPEEPEYVLNNDQAYNLLDNLTSDTAETTTENSEEGREEQNTRRVEQGQNGNQSLTSGTTGGSNGTSSNSIIDGINTIINQINSLITTGSVTNSNLSQIIQIQSMLYQLSTVMQELKQQQIELDQSYFEETFNLLNAFYEMVTSGFDQNTMNQNSIIQSINSGNSLLQQLISILGGGFQGSWKGAKDSGTFAGEFVGGNSEEDDDKKGNISDTSNTSNIPSGTINFQDKVEEVNNSIGKPGSNLFWKSYSGGLDNGAVTYTGLAMLHGSPTEPEYVLNNDQALNLLSYLTQKPAEYESIDKDSGTSYIVQGDIILEDVGNPSEFWNEVTRAMGNRWSVIKNNR